MMNILIKSRLNTNQSTGYIVTVVLLFLFSSIQTSLISMEPVLEQEIIKPAELYIGTPFYLNVKIITDQDQEVYHPVKDTIDVFAVTDIRKETSQETEKLISKVTYRLAPFETGELRLPPLTFEIFDSINNEITLIRSLPENIFVNTVLADTSMVIKDITAPFRLKFGFWDYFIPLIILTILTLLIILFWKRIFKKKDLAEIPEELDTRPAYQKALELLEQLRQQRLLEKGEYLEYYFQLSYILRYFLERNYKFNAVEMTSSEIRAKIRDFAPQEREELGKFLIETDLVKFAKYVPYVNNALEKTKWLESYLRSFAGQSSEVANQQEEN